MSDEKKPKIVISTLRKLPHELIIPGDGERARLVGTGVMEYFCHSCTEVWWMGSNSAAQCPACCEKVAGGNIEARWTTPQTAFIPQTETKVMSNGNGGKNGN